MRDLDLSRRTDLQVPIAVIAELTHRATVAHLEILLIGAAARDLVVHAPRAAAPKRATVDVDVAVAVTGDGAYADFVRGLDRVGSVEHKFLVLGIEVDVVPFGPIEEGRSVRFADDHELDVTGIAEASKGAVRVMLPGGVTVHVASLAAQAAMKVLAWRDRRHDTRKDAPDLAEILRASSEGVYGDATWEDEEALRAMDFDIITAGAYRTGRLAAGPFAPPDAASVLAVLDDPQSHEALIIGMRDGMASDLLAAFREGFRAEISR